MKMNKTSTILLIMDGYGLAPAGPANAISAARTPNIDRLLASCPNTTLSASGLDVGLPEGQMGNSEVGHTNLGAGRVVMQELPRISLAAKNGEFMSNHAYRDAMVAARSHGSALHLAGLLSDGGVHSHIDHLFALLDMAKALGLKKVYIHAFLDGRDVPPKSAVGYIQRLSDKCAECGVGQIATVQGRFYAMDRDKRWERLQTALDALLLGRGKVCADPVQGVEEAYAAGLTDEFVEPIICCPEGLIKSGDSFIFTNFRPDRARELTWALTGHLPADCPIKADVNSLHYVCTAAYDETLTELPVAFPPESIENTLGDYVSSLGLTQLRIAETEKYAHVTFFFNGGVERPCKGEDRTLIDSPREYPTYDLIPEMSAEKVTDGCVAAIKSGKYDLIVCNLANCDMVGHTGVFDAAVSAVETVDRCVGRITEAAADCGGVCLVTADHGNADCMLLPDGTPHTAHTTNLVPLIITGANVRLHPGRLADVAPTILALMGYSQPAEMTGCSLIDG